MNLKTLIQKREERERERRKREGSNWKREGCYLQSLVNDWDFIYLYIYLFLTGDDGYEVV